MCLPVSRYAFRGAAIARVAPGHFVRHMFFCSISAAREEINKRKSADESVIFIGAEWRENAKNSMPRSALVSSSG